MPDTPPALRLPCRNDNAAHRFVAWLADEGFGTFAQDGRFVLVPADQPGRAWSVTSAALDHGFARDADVDSAFADTARADR